MPVIAVFGGTPADTRLGAAYLQSRGQADLLLYPVAPSPRAQALFQNADASARANHMHALLQQAQARGAAGAYVYCNSLSGSTDLDALSAQLGFALVTPLHAYARWAQAYGALGIMAANASGLAGIERALYAASPALRLSQFGCLDIVDAIEQGQDPAATVQEFGLKAVTDLLAQLGAEAIILGCTHFSVFREALAPLSRLPLLDPSAEMWRRLQEQL